ncbi:hypothetical protein [Paenibacillus sp. PL91]|uniref:hypothetical protein n=1 Tax=Paenibacillus sp. PL91 TaxID=2729538 RepID=UPI00145C93EF|nr:hypothetical protein [Paenibacillus sp. PL91]MBC9199765.1 hypothetical protein [Paenibacillus sp. PL91]
MKVFTTDEGKTIIMDDEQVIELAQSVDIDAPYWEYIYTLKRIDITGHLVEVEETVRVDVSSHRPNLDTLSGLFNMAEATKRPEWAAAYLRHKTRVLALFKRRDIDGLRDE